MSKYPRTCFDCRWFFLDFGTDDWSDMTPGEEAEMVCISGHFRFARRDEMKNADYREAIHRAPTCENFEEDK